MSSSFADLLRKTRNQLLQSSYVAREKEIEGGCATRNETVRSGVGSHEFLLGLKEGEIQTPVTVRDLVEEEAECPCLSLTTETLIFSNVGSLNWTAPPCCSNVTYLVVGGGGGGGGSFDTGAGGGGGGGMVLTGTLAVLPGQTLSVTVGAGGSRGLGVNSGGTRSDTSGSAGGTSIFGTIQALGGDGGDRSRVATNGRHLGGVQQNSNISSGTGGSGSGSAGNNRGSGGGGGAGGDGGDAPAGNASGGSGGAGISSSLSGSSVTQGVGGAGNRVNVNLNGVSGTANTGNGGQGAASVSFDVSSGGNGGSGIVVIQQSKQA